MTVYLMEYGQGMLEKARPQNDAPKVAQPGVAYVTDAQTGTWTGQHGTAGTYIRYMLHDEAGKMFAKYWLEGSDQGVAVVAEIHTGNSEPQEEHFDAVLAALRARQYRLT